ncbi:MAG TPA: bifunctional diguanylate cyclase/phosphodiesterase [Solirubrobacteraceae bacterium]|nr:bifunctional diguanylate cyclase/phosphodiesterase [Solirubrobacteraceae bacterium]
MTLSGTAAQPAPSVAEDLKPPSRRHSRRALRGAAVVLVVGLVFSALSAIMWGRTDQSNDRKDFHAVAEDVSSTVGILLQRDTNFVATLRTVLTMDPHLTPTQFEAWYSRLQSSQRQVGGIGSAVVNVVAANDLERFQALRDADPAFIRLLGSSIAVVTPTGQRRYCLLASSGALAQLPGIAARMVQQDWCDPNTFVGSTEAGALWGAAGGDRVLVRPINEPWLHTTLFEVPFYRRGAPLSTSAQRVANTLGWVVSSFDVDTLLRQALGHNHGLHVRLQYTNPNGRAVYVAGVGRASGSLSQRTVMNFNGRWTVTVTGAPTVSGITPAAQGAIISAAGVVVTLLLSLLILTLSRSRERALQMVAEKTGQLRHQAMHDALTGLPNRVLAIDRAEQMLARARRAEQPIAVLYIDIDGFKHINDTFGHAVGDTFLRAVSARLDTVVRAGDTAARLAGDEFVVLLEASTLDAGPELVAERVLDVLREPYDLTDEIGRELSVTASIGVAYGCHETAEELLADADVALYAAKEAGRNQYVAYESGMQTAAQDRITLEMDLADAVASEELFLVYQPTFDLKTERTTGVEALLRWRHAERGVIAPDVFIPIAERSGLILAIGRWVLDTATRQAAAWRAAGYDLAISVNVSGRQLDHDQLVDDVRSALQDSGLQASALTVEITETALMKDPEATAGRLAAIKELGVRVAVDDFGTGYSSLAYLRQFPVDTLKIDRAFVQGIASSKESAALIQTLIDLGRSLDLETLGEGIEDPAQLQHLQRAQCDSGQGFLYARPLEADALTEFLSSRPADQLPAGADL